MKISKLLKMLLGVAFFRMSVGEEGGGGSEPLDAHSAADAFSSLLGDDGSEEKESQANDSPEAAAERLAKQEAEDAAAKAAETPNQDPADEAGDKITIEVDGKEVSLTKAELAESYKNGLRQADYTRKTMEAADARKAADAEANAARQERQDYAQKLNNYAIQLEGALQEQSQINWQQLLESDPVEYLKQERIFQQRQATLQQARQEQSRVQEQQKAEQAEARKSNFVAQHQELIAKLPDWKDPAKAKAESESIKAYLVTQGFDEQKLNGIDDHRDVIIQRKAMLYDALIQRASTATKKVAALPQKVERPGTASNTGKPDARTEALKRLGKTGSIHDAAAAFESFL